MLPTPVVTDGPPLKTEIVDSTTSLDVDLASSSIMKIKDAFASAIQPIVASINSLKSATLEALAPDPEAGVDRGKDLIDLKNPGEGADKEKLDVKGGFGLGAFKAIIIGALGLLALKFKDELQTLINVIKFPKILAGLSKVAAVFTLGFVNILGTIKKLKLVAGLGGAGPVSRFLSFFGKFTTQVGKFGSILGNTFKFLGPVMRVFSKLALPLTVIFSLIDAVKGFIEGYKDGGIIDGVLTAIGSVLGGLVGLPLDFVKNTFAFLLEKLGFEQIAEIMKDFSFRDAIKNIFGGIVQFFQKIPKLVEKGLRALPGGNFIADKIFGKDKDNEIAKREQIQKDAQETIDKEKGRQQELDVLEEAVDKTDPRRGTGRKKRRKRQIQGSKAASERRQVAAEDEQFEAARENVALKKGAGKMSLKKVAVAIASGKITSVEQAEEAIGRKFTPKEKDILTSQLQSERTISGDLETLESEQDIVADVMEKPRRKRSRFKKARQAGFAIDVVKTKVGAALDAPGTTTATIEQGKLVEGKALDTAGDPKGPAFVSAPSDNSSTDNSTTNNNNNVTNNNYGGGGGSMDTENKDGSLFSATKYASI